MRLNLSLFKILFIVALLIGSGVDSFSQSKKKKHKHKHNIHHSSVPSGHTPPPKKYKESTHEIAGDKFFEMFEYVKAAEEYKKAYEKDSTHKHALFQLAESYRLYFDYYNAEIYYHEVVNTALHDFPIARYWYGLMLKDNKRYVEAKEELEKFRKEYKAHDLQAELYKEKAFNEIKGCDRAVEEEKKVQHDYEFKALPIPANSTYSDFSPVIYDNDSTIVLTSTREEATGSHQGGIGGNLTDLFRFKKEGGDTWTAIAHQHDGFDVFNSPFNDGSGSYTEDGKKFYFTRCNEKVRTSNYLEYSCAIYVSAFKDGKWSKPIKLNENVNLPGYWSGQPSISPDGTLLFFVSLRPGGIGMHDIWYCTSAGDDNWSKAINMGEHVNTLFSEVSPRYYAKERMLFFSSNGHENFGGFDIFYVNEDSLQIAIMDPNIDAESIEIVKNIGIPFNSNRDDQYFVMGEKRGYISSNREGGIGHYDVYTFSVESKETLIAYIKNDTVKTAKSVDVEVVIKDKDNRPAEDVPIQVKDIEDKTLAKARTDSAGVAVVKNLPIDKDLKITLDEKDKNKKITVEKKYKAESTVKYTDRPPTKELFENIYFDFNQASIKTEAEKVLQKLVAFYKAHPEIQIELNAYTDSYGSDEYNKKLSMNRGNVAMRYLIEHGIKKTSLVVSPEGEGRPVATNNSELGRALNRRVEFYIRGGIGHATEISTTKIDPKERAMYYFAKQNNMTIDQLEKSIQEERSSMTVSLTQSSGMDYYIVQPKNTLYTIARLYGMSLSDLREINGITDTYQGVVVGQKLRIRTKTETPSIDYYLVKDGETLYSISKKFSLTVDQLVKMNNMEGYVLRKNMLLKIKAE